MHIRSVGEHVTKRTDFTIATTRNETIKLPAATSAMAMFVSPTVTLKDTKGNILAFPMLHFSEHTCTFPTYAP
jgi:hypothetical protein